MKEIEIEFEVSGTIKQRIQLHEEKLSLQDIEDQLNQKEIVTDLEEDETVIFSSSDSVIGRVLKNEFNLNMTNFKVRELAPKKVEMPVILEHVEKMVKLLGCEGVTESMYFHIYGLVNTTMGKSSAEVLEANMLSCNHNQFYFLKSQSVEHCWKQMMDVRV